MLNHELSVIYVARNPKDTVVSLYHHAKSKPEFVYTGDFNTFCEIFLAGNKKQQNLVCIDSFFAVVMSSPPQLPAVFFL